MGIIIGTQLQTPQTINVRDLAYNQPSKLLREGILSAQTTSESSSPTVDLQPMYIVIRNE